MGAMLHANCTGKQQQMGVHDGLAPARLIYLVGENPPNPYTIWKRWSYCA